MDRLKMLHMIRFKMKGRKISMRAWAIDKGLPYTLVQQFLANKAGKSGSPFTICADIEAALKKDGLWPTPEELKEVANEN